MPIDGGFVGMVDREVFDEFLRERARRPAPCAAPACSSRSTRPDGTAVSPSCTIAHRARRMAMRRQRARTRGHRRRRRGIAGGEAGDPGRRSRPLCLRVSRDRALAVRRREGRGRHVAGFDGARCDVYYQGPLSPDFYGWIFPHGDTTSVGTGTRAQGILDPQRGGRAARTRPGWPDPRPFAAKARRFRCGRCASGTTAATSCWPAMRRASSRRRPAKASTTRWSAAGSPAKRSRRFSPPATRARWPARASDS